MEHDINFLVEEIPSDSSDIDLKQLMDDNTDYGIETAVNYLIVHQSDLFQAAGD